MFENLPFPLAAGWDDLLKFIVPFIFLIFWIVSQIFEAKKQVGPPPEKPAGPPQPQPPQPRMQNEAPLAAGRQADPLREQVDEFLRRAGRGPQRQEPRPPQRRPQPAVDEIEVLLDDDDATPLRKPLAEPLRPIERTAGSDRPVSSPATRTRIGRRASATRRETVAEHVDERIGSSSRALEQATSRLGQRIIQDDAQFDVQLKAKFDHSVGTLAGSTLRAEELHPVAAKDSPAAQIVAMLSNPDGVRQAIVLNEILRRPSDRW